MRAWACLKFGRKTVFAIFDRSSLILDRSRKTKLDFSFLQSARLQILKHTYLSIAQTLRLDMFCSWFANTIQS